MFFHWKQMKHCWKIGKFMKIFHFRFLRNEHEEKLFFVPYHSLYISITKQPKVQLLYMIGKTRQEKNENKKSAPLNIKNRNLSSFFTALTTFAVPFKAYFNVIFGITFFCTCWISSVPLKRVLLHVYVIHVAWEWSFFCVCTFLWYKKKRFYSSFRWCVSRNKTWICCRYVIGSSSKEAIKGMWIWIECLNQKGICGVNLDSLWCVD